MTMIFTCSGTTGTATSGLGPAVVPTCNPASAAAWVDQSQPWWSYTIPADQVGSLLSALIFFAAVIVVCVAVGKALKS